MAKRKSRKSDTDGKKPLKGVPTVDAIQKTEINEIAVKYWAPYAQKHLPFDVKIVQHLYTNELLGSLFSHNKVVLLEFSQYLEAFLWPNYNPDTSPNEHLLSIIAMVNEKYRERVPAWGCFVREPEKFNGFFRKVLEAALDEKEELAKVEQSIVITFLVHCFNSVEVDVVRSAVQRLVSLPCWINLLPSQREEQFVQNPKLRKFWQVIPKHDARLDKQQLEVAEFERRFLWRLIHKFFDVLDEIPLEGEVDLLAVHYCERALELMIDLEALLPTRRFFNALLDASHAITRCTLSALIRREEGALFCELLQMLRFYARFEIDDVTGQQGYKQDCLALSSVRNLLKGIEQRKVRNTHIVRGQTSHRKLTEGQMTDRHYAHVTSLQKAAFKHFKDSMRDFYLLNVGGVDTRKALVKLFNSMNKEDLYKFAEYMHMVPPLTDSPEDFEDMTQDFLTEMLVSRCERRPNQLQQLNEMPLYPTEAIIWDENMVPYEHYNGEGVLALNKLNLQFLTLHDYLLRNFSLFQMESTYEIRKDLEDSIIRMKPWLHENAREVVWGGWARMAQPLMNFTIVEVSKPNIGEKCPSSVRADVTINLGKRADIRHEWEGLRKHDVCFLVTCRPTKPVGTKFDIRLPFKEQFEVAYVRGAEVEGMLDGQGRVIEEFGTEPRPVIPGDARSFRLWLDTNQYRADMEKHVATQSEDLYETFNLLVRRDAKSNNFKAVLDTMRQLLNTECVVPDWLHDLILGYGEPDSAHYSKMPNTVATMDFNDTFTDYQHLLSAFPEHKLTPTVNDPELLVPPFRLTFKELEPQHGVEPEKRDKSIVVEPHVIPSRGPYPYSEPKKNTIRFTPAQVEAIKSGMEPGLTMVVGPPGTGKTDVAVQIISNIYHNWPEQRTLIVTHSNQALNQLFEKIMGLDIDERHLLRLGHGEEALETTKDFSRYGRVNYVLAQRLELLKEVERLQQSLGVVGDVSYTCETAQHFFLYQVYARWEEFEQATKQRLKTPTPSVESVAINFPFSGYFDNAPQPLFKGVSYDEDWAIAQGCWRHIRRIFDELEEFRAFELLRSGRDRTEYLLVKEAKIIAMTCTHSALRRKDLVQLGFRYDNILMEESAQILEVETFIPLLLQNPQDGHNRLKRWIMIGDHHQLPPVIQNMAFQKYSNMEQSLFTRFVRLGVPTVLLDAQGRARSSIAQLYNWRYRRLGNLPHVAARSQFRRANAGFVFDYQLIDVQDFNGAGETTPSPYFYQNLGEAEYAVAIFMYMRILGYPADKISIITTYNGQAQLLRDVVERRCATNPLFGRPHKISTVDKFQGQQNDFIILSLVRTKAVGHLRDVRRLIVALSRARLGLFILGRVSLFSNCFELTPAFNILCQRPQKLLIVPNEQYPTVRQLGEAPPMEPIEIQDATHMGMFVHQFYTQNFQLMKSTYQEQMKDFIAVQKEAAAALASMQVGLEEKPVEKPTKPVEEEPEAEKEIAFEAIE